MNKELQELHLNVARLVGEEKSCGKKVNYKSFETAQKSAEKMSVKYKKEMEPYPCPFCNGWHIGRKMNKEELEYYIKVQKKKMNLGA